MPWELTIRNEDESLMGKPDEVIARISAAVSAFKWETEPSMLERIKDMPDHPFHALIPTWSEETKASMSRSKTYGIFDGDGFFVRLYGFDAQELAAVFAEVRWDGNPIPLIAAICRPNNWIAVDDATTQPIDLDAKAASGWEAFRDYRDRVIQSIKK